MVLVIDSFGAGAVKDVARVRPQDARASAYDHILGELPQLRLPTLERLELINVLGFVPGMMKPSASAVWGIAELQHERGDTLISHQEILGTRSQTPLRTLFSDVIDEAEQALRAVDWHMEHRGDDLAFLQVNDAVAVDDNLEADLGQVYNATASLAVIPLDEVLEIGRMVREQVQVGYVITFGGQLVDSQRVPGTVETKEGYFISINAPRSGACENGFQIRYMGSGVSEQVQIPQKLYDAGIPIVLVGKVTNIVGNPYGRSWQNPVGSQQIMNITPNGLNVESTVFICTNVQETDLAGYAEGMERYTERLQLINFSFSRLLVTMDLNNYLVVIVDRDNDPIVGRSHHTREVVPVLVYQQGLAPARSGIRATLSDVGATVREFFGAAAPQNGCSFLSALCFTGDILQALI